MRSWYFPLPEHRAEGAQAGESRRGLLAGERNLMSITRNPCRVALERLVSALLLAGLFPALPAPSAASDRAALVALHEATDGDNWSDDTNWLSGGPLSTWHGVITDASGRVTMLYLDDNNLRGEIPSELASLTELTGLLLARNALTGEIPAALADLRNLTHLSLSANDLRGEVPPGLGSLPRLVSLSLFANRLTGEIPAALGRLTALAELDLSRNALAGEIPAALGNLRNLASLSLSHNALTGVVPPELAQLRNLLWLDLSSNDLSGPIPAGVAELHDLRGLRLGSTRLAGPVPAALGNLPHLEVLDLAFNERLTGPIPARLRERPLADLDLRGSMICLPAEAAFRTWSETIARFRSSGLTCGEPVPAVSTIDLAVFYTSAASVGAGGTAAIEAVIDLMVAETNQAFEASGVDLQVALSVRSEVPYEEVDAATDLSRLGDPSDGHLDEVHVVRDLVGADLVHLVVGVDGYDAGGIADTLGAFGLTHYRADGGTLAHELGHNMGLHHDRYDACRVGCTSWPFRFAYGYVNRRAFGARPSSSAQWRTLMASDAQCRAEGMRCRGLLRFSNPDQAYRGAPLGIPGERMSFDVGGPANAARVLNAMRHSVASLRDRVPGDRNGGMGEAFVFEDGAQTQSAPARLPAFPSGAELFAEVTPATQADAGLAEAATLRRREVTVDTERLARLATATRPFAAPALVLNLFDDVVLTAIVERRTPTFSGGHALSGRLQGIDSGMLTLVVNGAVVAGTVWTPAEAFRIRPAGPGRHVITQAGWPPGEGMHPRETKDSARTPSVPTEHRRGGLRRLRVPR